MLFPSMGCAQNPDTTADAEPEVVFPSTDGESDVPYVSTPYAVVDSMLSLAGVTEADTVYDLGSGDGRIPIRAATKYGAHGVGIEIKSELVAEARQNAQDAGVADRVEFREGDLFEADISGATVVTMYLLPSVNMELRPKLFRELSPGTRVVSHDFDMNEWEPILTKEVNGNLIFLWRIPEETPAFMQEPE